MVKFRTIIILVVAAQVSGTFSCLNSIDQSLSGIVTFRLGPATLLSLVSCMCPISSTLKIDVATTSTRDFDTLERVIFNIFFYDLCHVICAQNRLFLLYKPWLFRHYLFSMRTSPGGCFWRDYFYMILSGYSSVCNVYYQIPFSTYALIYVKRNKINILFDPCFLSVHCGSLFLLYCMLLLRTPNHYMRIEAESKDAFLFLGKIRR